MSWDWADFSDEWHDDSIEPSGSWWTRRVPDRFLLGADLTGLALGVLFWALGLLAYVPGICARDPALGFPGDGRGHATQTMVNTLTWRCDFGNGSGLFNVVDHGPVAWTVIWLLLLQWGARVAVRHQRALRW